MNTFVTVLKSELTEHRSWFMSWIIGINIYMLMILLVYPGEKGMQSFLDLLDDEVFQAILGEVGGDAPGFRIWISMLSSFNVILYLIFGLLAGSRIALKSVEDKTGELSYTLPLTRTKILIIRWIVVLMYNAIFLFLWAFPIYLYPADLPISYLFTAFWTGLLYMSMGVSIGMFFSIVSGSIEKAQQYDLLLILVFYVVQIMIRVFPSLMFINKVNLLEMYPLGTIILRNEIEAIILIKVILILITSLTASLYIFQITDLIKDASYVLTSGNNGSEHNYNAHLLNGFTPLVKLIVFIPLLPIRILEIIRNSTIQLISIPLKNSYPVAMDFIRSEQRTLKVVFWSIILFWPGQLLFYPGDESTKKVITDFGASPIMKIFTYNHNLENEPWLWFIISQSIGTLWVILIPLTLSWMNKLVRAEISNDTGEIIGSLPLHNTRVIFERILAITIELVWMIGWMIFWLVLSEFAVSATYNLTWEIIAIILVVPLYIFLLGLTVIIGLSNVTSGMRLGRMTLLLILALFVIGTISDSLNHWYILGIFGLYDPVEIILDQSLASLFGTFIVSLLTILTLGILKPASRKLEWIDTSVKS